MDEGWCIKCYLRHPVVRNKDKNEDIERFIVSNKLKLKQKEFLLNLFDEAKTNNFTVNLI